MADGPFGAAVGAGPATPISTGSPEYQKTIVEGAQRQLAPMYRQALQGTLQGVAGRGLLDSGANIQARLGTQQDYLRQMGGIASEAATRAADVAEQNRRIEQQQQFQRSMLERQIQAEQEMAQRAEAERGAKFWSNLISGGAGAIGGALLGPLGGVAGQSLANLFTGGGGSRGSTSTATPSSFGGGQYSLMRPEDYSGLSYTPPTLR